MFIFENRKIRQLQFYCLGHVISKDALLTHNGVPHLCEAPSNAWTLTFSVESSPCLLPTQPMENFQIYMRSISSRRYELLNLHIRARPQDIFKYCTVRGSVSSFDLKSGNNYISYFVIITSNEIDYIHTKLSLLFTFFFFPGKTRSIESARTCGNRSPSLPPPQLAAQHTHKVQDDRIPKYTYKKKPFHC